MKKRNHRVEDFMSRSVVFLRESDHVSQALREMTVSAIRHIPIVDARGRLVGLASSHDIVAAVERPGDPELSAIMTRAVVTVSPRSSAEAAVGLMIDGKLDCLPVTGSDGELLGIITATDFLVVAHQALSGAVIERVPSEI